MKRRAELIIDAKRTLATGAVIQVKVWQLPVDNSERPHGLKYSLFYGYPGRRIVGYDNEAGKGDHRHYGDREEPYSFTTLARLLADFDADVAREIAHE